MAAARKPHVLLLIDDEHRPDVLPIEGNAVVRTPTLDRLIGEGCYFRNAYTPSPICVPARQSFLSGLYPRNCGSLNFGDPMPTAVPTIPGQLGAYGYYAASAGKMHFVGGDVMHGWRERIGRDIVGDNGYPVPEPIDQSRVAAPTPEPGTGMKLPIEVKFQREIIDAQPGVGRWMRDGEYSVDGALLFLEQYFVDASYDRPKANPLCMAVSINAPHYPYQCPLDLFNYYMQRVEPIDEQPPEDFVCSEIFRVRLGTDVTHRQAHRATAAYYGMVEWVDSQFGRVIALLEHLGVLDDFVVVFLSDHGEMLGSKGMWEKQQYFEESARVPFAVWTPALLGREPRTVEHNVSLVDLFPTLCELANVPAPPEQDGVSLVPYLTGHGGAGAGLHEQRPVYSELWQAHNGPSLMVKRGDLKYFRFDNDKQWPEQLYDLAADPQERHNRRSDPQYAGALTELRGLADALPPPRRKDADNQFLDPYRPYIPH